MIQIDTIIDAHRKTKAVVEYQLLEEISANFPGGLVNLRWEAANQVNAENR